MSNEPNEREADLPVPPAPDSRTTSYFEKLIKYIPAELIAAHTAIDGILREELVSNPIASWLYWGVFLFLLVLTPLYVKYRPTEEAERQSVRYHCCAATVSFAVWVFALGGPFVITWPEIYRPVYGSLLLILTTLTIPIIEVAAMKLKFFQPNLKERKS